MSHPLIGVHVPELCPYALLLVCHCSSCTALGALAACPGGSESGKNYMLRVSCHHALLAASKLHVAVIETSRCNLSAAPAVGFNIPRSLPAPVQLPKKLAALSKMAINQDVKEDLCC
jgi:hypothetical protein